MNIHSLTSGELHDSIEDQIINPNISEDIKTFVLSRKKWRKVSNITETMGQISMVAATILAFASGFYKDETVLAFLAGSVNVASIALLKFSVYASGESSERNKLLNELLIRCDIKPFEPPVNNNVQQSIVPNDNIHYVTPNIPNEEETEIVIY